jgi:hypothetical protein
MPNQFRTTGQQPSPPGIFHYHGGFPQRRSSSLSWAMTLNSPTDGTYLARALQQQTISIRGARIRVQPEAKYRTLNRPQSSWW